jgi:hypothetical protein
MKYATFCWKKNGDCPACLKNTVSFLVAKIYKLLFWGPVVHPLSVWDARLVKVKTVIECYIVLAHSLTSIVNATVDRTVQDQNKICLSVPDVMSHLLICSQEDINLLHNHVGRL